VATLTETLSTRTTSEWTERLQAAGVPSGPVLTLDQVYGNAQVRAREMDIEIEHPVAGHIHAIGMPVKYSATPGRVTRPAPVLGQHTGVLLRSLGVSPAECRELEASGIIHDAHLDEPPENG
jgi:crotonobetainyl-CoA:carnitine CoA-transferase CaiB-like acyl-CoA transferase